MCEDCILIDGEITDELLDEMRSQGIYLADCTNCALDIGYAFGDIHSVTIRIQCPICGTVILPCDMCGADGMSCTDEKSCFMTRLFAYNRKKAE
jgi:hypothetical protein